mmetsp:Transcript_14188/g.38211  ORF Transcript_14188/g.38211 Transcript_14188/m.38211 type:complete len:144 (+) Transcript_14188:2-433(+)
MATSRMINHQRCAVTRALQLNKVSGVGSKRKIEDQSLHTATIPFVSPQDTACTLFETLAGEPEEDKEEGGAKSVDGVQPGTMTLTCRLMNKDTVLRVIKLQQSAAAIAKVVWGPRKVADTGANKTVVSIVYPVKYITHVERRD